uniref:Uncharacterized protein n=1 Tax=CrAss-like virus sp. ctXt06 TaxID=2825837 RepID=A0A8S5V775_9CAUD|nr:MAG TPA: hypothetical protein [CrAss-like virus sp. ctXt06]
MLSKKIYNQFISDGDYVGAANYLSRAHFSDPVKQSLVNQAIKKLRTDGRRIQGMMSRADKNQRKAFSFLNAVNSNGILPGLNNGIDADGNRRPSDNVFSKDYAEAKRRLGSQGSKEAESLSIKFGGQTEKRRLLGLDFLAKDYEYKTDAFEDMLRRSRLSKNALIKSGAKVKVKDGQYVLDISKRNPLFNKVYNALLSTKGYDNKYRFQVAGIDAKGKLIGIGDSDKDYINWRSRTDITDTDGYYINPTGNNNFEMPNNIIAVANKAIRPVKDNDINGSKLSTVSSMILPFNSARRKQISDALNGGRLNTELANALVKENGNAIINGLMNADFTQYEMYVTDEENTDDHTTVRHIVDSSNEKANIQDLVRAAIASGKFDPETQVSLGMQGNQTGYVITIPTKIDNDTETGNRVEDIKQNSRQIFIPDFMNGEAEKVFSQNSQTRAMKELASMEMYNYPVDIPQDGRLNVYNDPSTGKAVYQMEYDSGRVQPLTREDALRKVNKMLIVEDGIDLANKQFYDEDGNLRKGLKNRDGSLNTQFQQDLSRQVDTYVTSAMSELYPQAWQSFAPIANNVINGDFSSEDYKTKLAKAMDSFVDTDNINLINNQRAIYSNYILSNIGMYDNDAYNID